MKTGVQLYTVRDYINTQEDIKETFKKLKGMGYDCIQTARELKDISYKKFGELAKEAGLEICGSFDNFELMQNTPLAAAENHRELDTSIMGLSFRKYNTSEDVESTLEEIKKAAENIYPYGFKFAYHNHSHEFAPYKNKTILDYFIEETPKEKVIFCLDTYWVHVAGYDVCEYIRKLSGRLDILHLKDYGIENETPYTAAIGDGILNWDEIISAARKADVKYYVVEQDDCRGEDPFKALERSRKFLDKYVKEG